MIWLTTCAFEMVWLTSCGTFKASVLAEFGLPHSDWSNPRKDVHTCLVIYTYDKVPLMTYKLPLMTYKLPLINYKLPLMNYKLPLTNYKLPLTNYKLPLICPKFVIGL